jgi:hypothetical protein
MEAESNIRNFVYKKKMDNVLSVNNCIYNFATTCKLDEFLWLQDFFFHWLYSPLGPSLWFLSFMIILQAIGLLGQVISSLQGLYLNTGQHIHRINTYIYQTSMPWVGFEPTIRASERAKTVHTSERAATVTGRVTRCTSGKEWAPGYSLANHAGFVATKLRLCVLSLQAPARLQNTSIIVPIYAHVYQCKCRISHRCATPALPDVQKTWVSITHVFTISTHNPLHGLVQLQGHFWTPLKMPFEIYWTL